MHGLVFRIHDKIFLSEYDEDGGIGDAEEIDDPKGIYNTLTENQVSFVEIHRYQQDVQYLRDLRIIKITNDDDPTKTVLLLIKEALQTCNNDITDAEVFINENWHSTDRTTSFRTIYSYVHQGRIGVMFEIGCGTDFVAKTEAFQSLCKEIALQLVAGLPEVLEEQIWIRDTSKKVGDLIEDVSKKTGEPIKVARSIRWGA